MAEVLDVTKVQNALIFAAITELITDTILKIKVPALANNLYDVPVSHGLVTDIVMTRLHSELTARGR